MRDHRKTELKVGFFVLFGTIFLMGSVFLLGGLDDLFTFHNQYWSRFKKTDGLMVGSRVELNGIRVGMVDDIQLINASTDVRVRYSVKRSYSNWIRETSTVEVLTQGVLGDKYLSIEAGESGSLTLENGAEITAEQGKALSEFISDGGDLMSSLKRIAVSLEHILGDMETDDRSARIFEGLANTSSNLEKITNNLNKEVSGIKLKESVSHLNSILGKIDGGSGTVGALINDPTLFDDAKSLIGGMNRNRIMRNLVRQTIRESEENSTPATNP